MFDSFGSRRDIGRHPRHVVECPAEEKASIVWVKKTLGLAVPYLDVKSRWVGICIEFGTGAENLRSRPVASLLQRLTPNIEAVIEFFLSLATGQPDLILW